MCNLSKGIEEKGIKEGILSSIQNLMESMGWSAEQSRQWRHLKSRNLNRFSMSMD